MKKQPVLLVTLVLFISDSRLTLTLAKDALEKESEVWAAPPQAARKANPAQADDQSRGRGRELYTKECLPCHGQSGRGDGPKAGELKRKPTDLSQPKVREQSDGELFWKITEGKTPMPSFENKFSEPERWDIINYIRTLGAKSEDTTPAPRDSAGHGEQPNTGGKYVSREEYEKLKGELEALKIQIQEALTKGAPLKGEKATLQKTGKEASQKAEVQAWSIPPKAAGKRNPVPADGQSFARGKEHYTAECLVCHGPAGKGDGPKASELGRSPSDLSSPTIEQQTDGELFWKTTAGKTPMPSFKAKFSDKQRWDIVNYIRTFASKSAQTNRAGADTLTRGQEAPKKGAPEKTDKGLAPKAEREAPQKAETDQVQALDDLGQEIKQLKQMAKESFPGASKFLLTGYGSAGFTAQNNGGDKFFSATFNPILLWKMSDRLLFEGELEAELENHDTHLALELAQISYVLNDYMTLGAGKFLSPMNYFVERQHMAWVNKLPDKPLAVYDGLLPEASVGFQIRGGVPVGVTKFGYALYVANAPELRMDTNSVSATDLGTLEFDNFDNIGKHVAVGGRVGFFPIPELEIGYGIQYADVTPPDSPNHVNALLQSADLSYVRDSAALKGIVNLKFQWVWSRVDRFSYDPDGAVGGPFPFKNSRNGGYAQVAYRPSRLENWFIKNLESVVRYDMLNQAGTQTGVDERRLTLGLNYWLAPSTVLKVAYELDHQRGSNADRHDAFLLQFAIGF
jgi:mono/diheme cytochrome c family protein